VTIYEGHGVTLHHGDCLDVLRSLPDCSVDSVVCDPPYGLEFMGKEWDSFRPDVIVNRGGGVPGRAAWDSTKMAPVEYGGAKQRSTLVCDGCGKSDKFRNAHDCPDGTGWTRRNLDTSAARVAYAKAFQDWCEAWATECLRVLKPGGHLLAFGGTRTWHRLACAVEDAGFEIRDSLAWIHGQGFPKSLDVSKAIDKAAGAERSEGGREWSGGRRSAGILGDNLGTQVRTIYDAPATDAAREWAGWGTALKPAFEPVVVARKPLIGTVAANVLAHGTGALNVDGCRIEHRDADDLATSQAKNPGRSDTVTSGVYGAGRPQQSVNTAGRWPANVVLDDSQARLLDAESGERGGGVGQSTRGGGGGGDWNPTDRTEKPGQTVRGDGREIGYGDTGGASRFFPTFRYEAKAPQSERPRYTRPKLRLRGDLTPEQVDRVRARLAEAGVQVD